MKKLFFLVAAFLATTLAFAQTAVFEETFADITDGNSTDSNGSATAWTPPTGHNIASVAYAYQAGDAVKVGSSRNAGYVITKAIDLSQATKLIVKIKSWGGKISRLEIKVDEIVVETLEVESAWADDFVQKEVVLPAATSTSTITMTTIKGTGVDPRCFIDNIKVVTDGEGGGGTGGGEDPEPEDPEEPEPQIGSYYEKVTSAPADWSGTYVLVYESTATEAKVWNGEDVVSNCTTATITDNEIYGTFTEIEIAPMEGGYSLKVVVGEEIKYLGGAASSNIINFNTDKFLNTLEFIDNSVKITSATSVMRFNNAANQDRFRYFKSASYTNQKPVQLYKKAAPRPQITATPNPIDFGTVNAGLTASIEVTITGQLLDAEQGILCSVNNSQFTVNVEELPAAGGTITVAFDPTELMEGVVEDVLQLLAADESANFVELNIPITATVHNPNVPKITANLTSIDFGTVQMGETVTKTVQITGANLPEQITAIVGDGKCTFVGNEKLPATGGELTLKLVTTAESGTIENILVLNSGSAYLEIPITATIVEPADTYTKVTAAPIGDDWSGTYVLVYETNATSGKVWNGTSGSGNFVEQSITDGTITASGLVEFEVAKSGDAYSVTMLDGENAGQALNHNGNSNGIEFGKNYNNLFTFIYNSEKNAIDFKATSHIRYLRFNNESSLFNFYDDKYSRPQLYKRETRGYEPQIVTNLSVVDFGEVEVNASEPITATLNVSLQNLAEEVEYFIFDEKFTIDGDVIGNKAAGEWTITLVPQAGKGVVENVMLLTCGDVSTNVLLRATVVKTEEVTTCFSYTWAANKETYTESGTYESGFDRLNLVINNAQRPVITGPDNVLCNATNVTYSVEEIAGYTYDWIPNNATIVSGGKTHEVVVNFSNTDASIGVEVRSSEGCTMTKWLDVHVNCTKSIVTDPEVIDLGELVLGQEKQLNVTVTGENIPTAIYGQWAFELFGVSVTSGAGEAVEGYDFVLNKEGGVLRFSLTANEDILSMSNGDGIVTADLRFFTSTESTEPALITKTVKAKILKPSVVVEPEVIDFGKIIIGQEKAIAANITVSNWPKGETNVKLVLDESSHAAFRGVIGHEIELTFDEEGKASVQLLFDTKDEFFADFEDGFSESATMSVGYGETTVKRVTVKATAEPLKEWHKVTKNRNDWSGTYILVYEYNADSTLVWNGVDAINSYTVTKSVEGVITGNEFAELVVEPMTNGKYSVQVGENYVGREESKNGINFSDLPLENTFSVNTYGEPVLNGTCCTMTFNKAKDQMRFRYMTQESQHIDIYRLCKGENCDEEDGGEVVALEQAELFGIYAENGRIFGADDLHIYTVTGLDVTRLNGNLQGVYIVKSGENAVKVIVK